MPDLLISDLAARSGVPASTLRYYEQVGLLPAARTPAGYRTYDQAAVERLGFISAAKHLHLSLGSIRVLLGAWEAEPCQTVKAQLLAMIASRLGEVHQGIAGLRGLEESLRTAVHRLNDLPDRNESCDPTCASLADRIPSHTGREPVPIVCSLAGHEQRERLSRWHELLDGAVIDIVPNGARVRIATTEAERLMALIVAEQQCCPFLEFEMSFESSGLQLTIRAPREARALINDLLPSRPFE